MKKRIFLRNKKLFILISISFIMKKKTKILAAGDIHGDTGLVKKLVEKAKKENVDLVILAGDITFFEQSTKNIVGPFLKAGKQVLILPGNHESVATTDFLAEMYAPGAQSLHGYYLTKNDIGIFGAGGMPLGPSSEKEVFKLLERGNNSLKAVRKRIMVTHMHAKGIKSEFSGWEGSEGIRKAVEKFQPDLFIHSHIHEAEGAEEMIGKTKVINVGRKGKIFEI